jgi:6-phosphogluconolactonase (cycloisomerase 2 family)
MAASPAGLYWAGSYTAAMDGTSLGIGALRPRADGSLEYLGLAVATSCPSFLSNAVVPGVVYATDEAAARVGAFRRDGERLVPLGGQPTGGTSPCHITATAEWLYVANYGTGTVDAFPLSADGSIGPRRASLAGAGSGPHPAQVGPHAHSTLVVGDAILSADLGADRVHVQRWSDGELLRVSSAAFPPGTGPRDFATTADGRIFLLGELSGEIFELDREGRPLRSGASVVDAVDGDHWAGLVIDDAGRFIYTGLRGSNRIAVVDARTLSPVATISCGGDWPRHLWLSGELLYVANERSSTVTSFRIDRDSGLPVPIGAPEDVPTPTYLLPAA